MQQIHCTELVGSFGTSKCTNKACGRLIVEKNEMSVKKKEMCTNFPTTLSFNAEPP